MINDGSSSKASVQELLSLVDYHEIVWPLKHIKDMYELEDRSYLKKVLSHFRYRYVNGKEQTGYDGLATSNIIRWVLSTRDYDLIDFAANNNIKERSLKDLRNVDIFLKAFEEGGEYWEHAKGLFSEQCYTDTYYNCVMNNKASLLKKLIQYSGIGVSEDVIQRSLKNHPSNTEVIMVLIDNYDPMLPNEYKWRPLWEVLLPKRNIEILEHYLLHNSNLRDDEETMQNIIRQLIWECPSVEKAKLLVRICDVNEDLLNEAALAERISPEEALTAIEKKLEKEYGRKVIIYPSWVTVSLFDLNTWKVDGTISTSIYDKPSIELSALVSIVDDKDTEVDIKKFVHRQNERLF